MQFDAIVTKKGRSVCLSILSPDAARLGLQDGQRLRITIDDAPEFMTLVGKLKGRVPASRLHALTNEDEEAD
jgi:hypothetical protein